MKILAISDLHGFLPEIPECDLLLVAGDICPDYHQMSKARYGDTHKRLVANKGEARQGNWLNKEFREWLDEVPAEKVIGIAGNHDFVFETGPLLVPRNLRWTYLRDAGFHYKGLNIYGIPWVPNLPRWAFSLEADKLQMAYDLVPDNTDIVLSHGPPEGWLDFTAPQFGSMHAGASAANKMLERVRPAAYICGHIHEGRGEVVFKHSPTETTNLYNVAHVDESYQGFRGPVEIKSPPKYFSKKSLRGALAPYSH